MARGLTRLFSSTAPRSPQLPQAILLDPSDSGLAVARSLHGRGVRVCVLATEVYSWVARSRSCDGWVLDGPLEDPAAWLSRLRSLAERGDGVLIPGSDRISEFVARERSQIPERLLSFESDASAHLELMDKSRQYALAERIGIRFPRTQHLNYTSELEGVVSEASYPCLLKPALSHRWRRLFGEHRVILVRDADELRRAARAPLEAALELLVTEYVPGPDRNLEAAVTVRRADGSLALYYGRRKLRQYPPHFGAGSIHESAEVPETLALGRRLLDAAGFVGVSNVEAKRHASSGEMVLIEVNVRLPQGFALGDVSGTDASWRLYATLAGLPLSPQPGQVTGVRTVVPILEMRAVGGLLLRRELSPRPLLASYRGVRSFSGLSPRDPGPVLALAAKTLRRLAGAVRDRARARIARRAFKD